MKQTIKVVSILSLIIMCLNVNAQLKVYNTGSISVGSVTSPPNAKLDVFTNTNTYGLIVGNSVSGNNIKIAGTAGAGLNYSLFQTFSGGTTAGGSLVFQRDGGNVGIGTPGPLSKLHISNSGAEGFEFYPGYSSNLNIIQGYNRSTSVWTSFDSRFADYHFKIGGYEKVTINTSGNVGIRTTTPDSYLSISGGKTNSTGITVKSGDVDLILTEDYSTNCGKIQVMSGNYTSVGTTPYNLVLQTDGGNVGIGTTNPSTYKLYVNGTSYFNGNGTYTGTWSFSDQQFKTHIDSLHNTLTTIKQLKPKSFYFDTTNVYDLNFSNKKQYGFIAQDVETILPELVTSTTKQADIDTAGNIIHPAITYKILNYNAFFGILTKGIQELQQKNDSLKIKTTKQDSINTALQNQVFHLITHDSLMQNQLDQLSSLITDCCNSHGNGHDNNRSVQQVTKDNQDQSSTALTNAELKDGQLIVLKQNIPNPFNQQTTIQYIIPATTQSASIMVFDLNGKLMKTIPITNYGSNSIIINGNELTPGMFVYSLIVDGKIIDTKKMILTD